MLPVLPSVLLTTYDYGTTTAILLIPGMWTSAEQINSSKSRAVYPPWVHAVDAVVFAAPEKGREGNKTMYRYSGVAIACHRSLLQCHTYISWFGQRETTSSLTID